MKEVVLKQQNLLETWPSGKQQLGEYLHQGIIV